MLQEQNIANSLLHVLMPLPNVQVFNLIPTISQDIHLLLHAIIATELFLGNRFRIF